jgi:hypothetical protein
MRDEILATLLSAGISGPAPAPKPPPRIAVELKQAAATDYGAKPSGRNVPPPVRSEAPKPLVVTAPREPATMHHAPVPGSRPPASNPIVWQLWCAGDGQLYKHTDKAYLERWVASRDALYANARAALQPKTFYELAPGYGYTAGCATGR